MMKIFFNVFTAGFKVGQHRHAIGNLLKVIQG